MLKLGLGSKISKMADSEELDCKGSPNETDDNENRLVGQGRLFVFYNILSITCNFSARNSQGLHWILHAHVILFVT